METENKLENGKGSDASTCSVQFLIDEGRSIKFRSMDEDWEYVIAPFNFAVKQLKAAGYTSKEVCITSENMEKEGTIRTIWLDDKIAWQATANRTAFNYTEYVITSFLPNVKALVSDTEGEL